MLIIVA